METNEIKMASQIRPLLTVADLDSFPEDDGNRYELITGELFVSRAPGIPHQRVLHNLQVGLALFLKLKPMGRLVPGAGTIFSDLDAVIPDLVFVRNERWEQIATGERFTGAADLIIEVLSPGAANRARDLESKRKLYEKFGVEEYWIVDPLNSCVLIFQFIEQDLKRVAKLSIRDKLTTSVLPGFELRVSEIFSL